MKFLNVNTIHNILNGLLVLVGAATGGLLAAGCTQTAAGAIDCTHSFVNPAYAGYIMTAIGVLKFVMNIARDGVSGLVAQQPPVSK
ncbi:MAG: hypothetical protein KGL39_50900 [Patescibacteria group bacterium]|nr:hypothetical protein [Patescibacteria group bacterium]